MSDPSRKTGSPVEVSFKRSRGKSYTLPPEARDAYRPKRERAREASPGEQPAYAEPPAFVFEPPDSIEAGEARRLALADKLYATQNDLSNREKPPRFRPRERDAYDSWRQEVTAVLYQTSAELRHLKAWLKEKKQARRAHVEEVLTDPDLHCDFTTTYGALKSAWSLLHRLAADLSTQLEPAEQELIDAVEQYLEDHAEEG